VNGRLLAICLRPAARLPVQSAALRPHRGGAFGSIQSGGLLQVGAAMAVVSP
jgi:hypothetical protein